MCIKMFETLHGQYGPYTYKDWLPVTSIPRPSPTVDTYLMKSAPDAIFDDM
ncbi:MAG: hypothetical protein ABRQ38_18890 [Candidatus Eremiobacterota bacterium]